MEFWKKLKDKFAINSVNKKKINIFTVYHKPSMLYKSKIVTPIHAGREIAFSKSKDGSINADDYKWLENNMIGDNTGENISCKNRFYNETTVLYWIWKNCKSSVAGLMHYRRLFDFSGLVNNSKPKTVLDSFNISSDVIKNILSEYDIILPNKLNFGTETVYSQYARYHHIEDLELALNIVKEKYPQMAFYADNLKEINCGYFFNMLIAKKDVFDKYAEYLFDVLFELSKRLPPREERNLYQQRIEAFIAERISTVYFNYMIAECGLKVKEVPVVHIENKAEAKRFMFKKSSRGRSLTILIKFRF